LKIIYSRIYNKPNLIINTWHGNNNNDIYKNLRELKKLLSKIELYKFPDYEKILIKLKENNKIIKTIFIKYQNV
jgi:hypothetical protein